MTETEGMKLLLVYHVPREHLQAYYQFVTGRYIPLMQMLGAELVNAWYTGYGPHPNRLVEFATADRQTMMALLKNETWHELNEQLQRYVTDFSYKVVALRDGFQL